VSSDLGGEAGAPIGRPDLVQVFHEAVQRVSGKPLLIGVEAEWLPVDQQTGRARAFEGPRGVVGLFEACLEEGFADPVGAELPTHLRRGGAALNLEPGGQPEFSGTPFPDLLQIHAELEAMETLLRPVAATRGFRLLAHGIQPLSLAGEIRQVPKRRYQIMFDHFTEHGGARFLDMMRLTASVQVSLDYESERDAGRKLRAAHLLAPIAGALFANSPIVAGRPTGWQSERLRAWLETDSARCGPARIALDGTFSFEALIEEVLDVPSLLVRADDGGVRRAGAASFRALLKHGIDGRPVTRADWDLHLSGLFTDARLKGVVECRAPDAPPACATLAPAAFYVGLLYHEAGIDWALDRLGFIAPRYMEAMEIAAREGLRGACPGEAVYRELAADALQRCRAGLVARGLGEERLLDPVDEMLTHGLSFADRAIAELAKGGLERLLEWAAL